MDICGRYFNALSQFVRVKSKVLVNHSLHSRIQYHIWVNRENIERKRLNEVDILSKTIVSCQNQLVQHKTNSLVCNFLNFYLKKQQHSLSQNMFYMLLLITVDINKINHPGLSFHNHFWFSQIKSSIHTVRCRIILSLHAVRGQFGSQFGSDYWVQLSPVADSDSSCYMVGTKPDFSEL